MWVILLIILPYIILVVLKLVCLLISIAYYTLAERKIMAAVQRRVGPNVVGLFGLLQPLADGLKLAGKEAVIPSQASGRIFLGAAMAVLLFALSGWSTIPFGLFDHSEFLDLGRITKILASMDEYLYTGTFKGGATLTQIKYPPYDPYLYDALVSAHASLGLHLSPGELMQLDIDCRFNLKKAYLQECLCKFGDWKELSDEEFEAASLEFLEAELLRRLRVA